MASRGIVAQTVPLSRIFLNHDNPRHDPVASEGRAIEQLCKTENILALAKDIVLHGTNPLELVGLVPIDARKADKRDPSYLAAEGNRRVCALKLLNDPERAPASLRRSFEAAAKGWTPTNTVTAVVFSSMVEARLWMGRLHNGAQGGAGRLNWDSDQKARFDGKNKNKLALAILDYAEEKKMLTAAERAKKITTTQKFFNNEVFKETLGLDNLDPNQLRSTRPQKDFDSLLHRFIRDLVGRKDVNSRMNKEEIIEYARDLGNLPGISSVRTDAQPLKIDSNRKTRKPSRTPPRKPQKARHVQHHHEIYQALRALGNEKLDSLYHSICSVELEHHTPLICIGVWSFFETLTACAGRHDGISFDSFLNKNRLASYGITGDTKALVAAMARIRDYANTTKHHAVAAIFNGEQINNDMNTLKEVIIKCIENIKK